MSKSIEPTRSRHLGKYELQTLLGKGGMAEVWKAFDPQLQRYVAIKLMLTELNHDPDFGVRFEREARLVASLDHPNIVKIHDFQISQPPESATPTAYMVMDYVRGQTLSDYMYETSRVGKIPSWGDIIYLLAATSRALDYAHQKGMVHRDIKPANILLDQRTPTARAMGVPILTDFGVARMQGVQTGTMLGSLVGTPRYIAPEQAMGQHGDRRCDLYSLGIVLYEIVTGVTPFRADTTIAVIMQHLHELPTSPALINPSIPSGVSEIILKSLSKRPEDRYFSATEMTMALAQTLNIPLPGLQQTSGASISNAGFTPLPLTRPEITAPEPVANRWQPVFNAQNSGPGIPDYVEYKVQALSESPTYRSDLQPVRPLPMQEPRQSRRPSQRRFSGIVKHPILFSILLFSVLVGGGLGFMVLWSGNSPSTNNPVSEKPVSGNVTFSQSAHATQGNYDQIQIDMHNVPPPPQGYVYYAWLVANTLENNPSHWKLVYNNGTLQLGKQSYTGHANLLTSNTLFLVTKESDASGPAVPYTDPQARLYYAQITNAAMTHFDIKECPMSNTANICLS